MMYHGGLRPVYMTVEIASSVSTLPVPILLSHTCTQHPPHAQTPHDLIHSGTLVSWVFGQDYSFLLSESMSNPDLTIRSDFIQTEVDTSSTCDDFTQSVQHGSYHRCAGELEVVIQEVKTDGRETTDVFVDNHMVFMVPPGTGKTTVIFFYHKFKSIIVYRFFSYTITESSMPGAPVEFCF